MYILPIFTPIARSFINRSPPVRHRTIHRAECVNDLTRDLSQGQSLEVSLLGLGYFLPILPLSRPIGRSFINRSPPFCHRTIPRARTSMTLPRTFRKVIKFVELGPPNVLFADFYHFGGLQRSPLFCHRPILGPRASKNVLGSFRKVNVWG